MHQNQQHFKIFAFTIKKKKWQKKSPFSNVLSLISFMYKHSVKWLIQCQKNKIIKLEKKTAKINKPLTKETNNL